MGVGLFYRTVMYGYVLFDVGFSIIRTILRARCMPLELFLRKPKLQNFVYEKTVPEEAAKFTTYCWKILHLMNRPGNTDSPIAHTEDNALFTMTKVIMRHDVIIVFEFYVNNL